MTKKRTILGALLLLLIALLGAYFLLGTHTNSSENDTETARQKFYKGFSGKKKEEVQDANKAVSHAVALKDDGQSTSQATKEANTKIDAISGQDQDTQELKTAYHSIVTVVDNPTVANLKTMRTNIDGMHAGYQASYLDKAYDKPLVNSVAKATGKTTSTVEKESKPDPKQTSQSSDQSSQKQAESSSQSSQNNSNQNSNQNTQTNQNTNQGQAQTGGNTGGGGTYTPPAQSGGSTYTPPAQSGSGSTYTPPANTPQISARPTGDYITVPGIDPNKGVSERDYNNLSEIR